MDGSQLGIARGADGRFLPGSSGNPAGKKTGTRNRATLLKEALREGEDATLARIVIDKALAGDAVAARFLLERLEPKPRGRPIHLDIPEGLSPAGEVVATFNAALRAMAAGEITPDEAVSVARFLEGRMRVLKAWQLEQKLTRWDNPLPIPGDDRPSPIPYPPPKEGWPDVLERVRLWGAPWPPPGTPSPTTSNIAAPSLSTVPSSTVPSPPVRGERVAKGWRGKAEPYPELGEGAAAARAVADTSSTEGSVRAVHPHPAPAKLDDVSLSLRNPLPQGGEGTPAEGGGTLETDLVAVRDRLLEIPWLRDLARRHGVLAHEDLHSSCIFEAPPPAPDSAPRETPAPA
jgi:hypothetical protein